MNNISILKLGYCVIDSPLRLNHVRISQLPCFIADNSYVLNRIETQSMDADIAFEKAGPREKIFFDPPKTRVAIVTCGGLCPGLNNVIRSLVLELYHNYGVRDIKGICYGYLGMGSDALKPMMTLDPDIVNTIDRQGGSLLGCSRGVLKPRRWLIF